MRPVSDCLAYLHVVRSFAESGCTCSSNRRTPLATFVCGNIGGPLSHEMGDAEPRFDQPENQKSVRLLTQDETAAGITRTAARVDRLNSGWKPIRHDDQAIGGRNDVSYGKAGVLVRLPDEAHLPLDLVRMIWICVPFSWIENPSLTMTFHGLPQFER
jgi:hypothetical protein